MSRDPRSSGPEGLAILPMRPADLPEVRAIELASLGHPWPEAAMRHEIEQNPFAHYWIARVKGEAVAYAGLWVQVDEMHVSMIAVLPDWRRKGLGEALLQRLLVEGRALGCLRATLEVREHNVAAQALYARHGFLEVGRRPAYYPDTGEAALILTTPDFGA
jgi:ribosomal-protein-alanine N-acetyltransferase